MAGYEHRFWYQYSLHGERGREGLRRNRVEFCRLLWTLWSPTWSYDETYAASVTSFENPDFVDVVVHSSRHRFGLSPGDPQYDDIESRLAAQPSITVPSVILLGADDGVDPVAPGSVDRVAARFTDPVAVRLVASVGHNLAQEDPAAFVAAVRALL